jgi:hypothetical protein
MSKIDYFGICGQIFAKFLQTKPVILSQYKKEAYMKLINKDINLIIFAFLLLITHTTHAQQIFYSEPDRDDIRNVKFEMAGKIGNNYIVYKNIRNSNYLNVFDGEMKLLEKVGMDFLPDRIINSDIVSYRDNFYFIYQYQRKNVVYCMAADFDSQGKLKGDPVQLDTTEIGFLASNKIYNVITSEDRQRIAVYKINNRNQDVLVLSARIFNAAMQPVSNGVWSIPMQHYNDFLAYFDLDNQGHLVILKANGSGQNDNISKLTLITTDLLSDTLHYASIEVRDVFLDDVHVKVDNVNNNYVLASFYSRIKRGFIDGMYTAVWSRKENALASVTVSPFPDELKENARTQGSTKTAFNDFYIQQIVMRKTGGYAVIAESVYSSSRGNNFNRWDNFYGSPFWNASNFYLYNNSPGWYYPWWGNNSTSQQNTRYFADNIGVFSFDSLARMQWANIVHKSQFDDGNDNLIGFSIFKTTNQIQFLYNELERREQLLNVQAIDIDGNIIKQPTLRNLDKGYVFLPRYARQTGARELIVPSLFRNYLCFARIVL